MYELGGKDRDGIRYMLIHSVLHLALNISAESAIISLPVYRLGTVLRISTGKVELRGEWSLGSPPSILWNTA